MPTPLLVSPRRWPAVATPPLDRGRDLPAARPGVIDLSLPPRRRSAWRAVLGWLEAMALAEVAGLLLLLLGTIVGGAAWLLVKAVGWLGSAAAR